MKIKYYVCDECGSDNLVWGAEAHWDIENQCMELANCFDDCWCNKCAESAATGSWPSNGRCHPVEKEKVVAA